MVDNKQEILAQALSVEDGEKLDWMRRRETDPNIMKPSARRGTYLFRTGGQGMFGNRRPQGQPDEWHGRGTKVQRADVKPRLSRRQRAKLDREAKVNGRG